MDANVGIIAAIAGSIVGLLGGAFGTYATVRSTTGPRERAFVVRIAVGCWFLVLAFVAGMLLIPEEQRLWLWIPYSAILTCGIAFGNRRHREIRQSESPDPME